MLNRAAEVIANDGIIAYPTETFYALGASIHSEIALVRLRKLKGDRPDPFSVAFAKRQHILDRFRVGPGTQEVLQHLLPGPLTIILDPLEPFSSHCSNRAGGVAVRLPDAPLVRRLLGVTGPLTATSANRYGGPPARTPEEVQEALGAEVDFIVADGPTVVPQASTIIDLTSTPTLIRAGPITLEEVLDWYAQGVANG